MAAGNVYAYAIHNPGGGSDPLPSLLDRGNFIFAGISEPGSELRQVQRGFDSSCDASIE
jgi:hypothetical protein